MPLFSVLYFRTQIRIHVVLSRCGSSASKCNERSLSAFFLFFRKKLIGQDSHRVIRFLLVLQPAPTKARAKSAMVSVIGLSKHVHRAAAFNANVSAFWNLISERGIFAVQPVQWQKCVADCSRRVKSSRETAREHQPDASPRYVEILWSAYTRLHMLGSPRFVREDCRFYRRLISQIELIVIAKRHTSAI